MGVLESLWPLESTGKGSKHTAACEKKRTIRSKIAVARGQVRASLVKTAENRAEESKLSSAILAIEVPFGFG